MNHEPLNVDRLPAAVLERHFERVARPVRVIDVDAERQLRRALRAFDFQERCAVRALLLVRVVEQQRAAQRVAVVENDRAARVLELGHRRMRDGAAVHAARLSRPAPESCRGSESSGRGSRGAARRSRNVQRCHGCFTTSRTSMSTISPSSRRGQQIAKRQHVRAETQLKIHRRDQPALAADVRRSIAPRRDLRPSASESAPPRRAAALSTRRQSDRRERRRRRSRPARPPPRRATRTRSTRRTACAVSRDASGLMSKRPATGNLSR